MERMSFADKPRRRANKEQQNDALDRVREALLNGHILEGDHKRAFKNLRDAYQKSEVVRDIVDTELKWSVPHTWRRLRRRFPKLRVMKVKVKRPRDYEKVASCAAQALGEERRDFSFYKEAMEHELYQWPQEHSVAMNEYHYSPAMFDDNVFLDAATFQPEKYLMNDTCVWEEGMPQPTETIQLASKSVRCKR
jgi:hypothetical protein